jgi:N-acetylglucosamine-6-phosphate deacetylase
MANDKVIVELIADGHHVHPSVMKMVVVAKGARRVVAITDGTAGSGLPPGSRTTLGGRAVKVTHVATLEDGTLAGSVTTMDRAFAQLVLHVHCSLVEAAAMCSTTPARDLGRHDVGRIETGTVADLVVLTRDLRVSQTWIAGRRVFHN